jgi:zinc transporter ZupT
MTGRIAWYCFVTAVLLSLTELLGCGVGVWALERLQSKEKIA